MRNSCFVHIPKTAGCTVMEAFHLESFTHTRYIKHYYKGYGHVTFRHQFYPDLIERGYISDEFDQSAWKYTMVRNPFDRFISMFYWGVRKTTPIEYAHQIRTGEIDIKVTRPMVDYCEGVDLDFIGKFEDLEESLKEISEGIGRPIKDTPHANINKNKPDAPYEKYYDEELRQIVCEIYLDDFNTFGYSTALI